MRPATCKAVLSFYPPGCAQLAKQTSTPGKSINLLRLLSADGEKSHNCADWYYCTFSHHPYMNPVFATLAPIPTSKSSLFLS